MSVYSGFATRQLETSYNTTLCQLLKTLQKFVLATLSSQPVDLDSWTSSFTKHFKYLYKLEDRKHLLPKYTYYCNDLAKFLEIKEAFHRPDPSEKPNGLAQEMNISFDRNISETFETGQERKRVRSESKQTPIPKSSTQVLPENSSSTQRNSETREKPPIRSLSRRLKNASSRVYSHTPTQSLMESPIELPILSPQERQKLPPTLSRRRERRAEFDRFSEQSSFFE
jgi:hypothetical protein